MLTLLILLKPPTFLPEVALQSQNEQSQKTHGLCLAQFISHTPYNLTNITS